MNEKLKLQLQAHDTTISAGLSGTLSVLIGHPFDTLKTRLQVNDKLGIRECVKSMVRTEGIKSFWLGMSGPLLFVSFFRALNFTIYNGSCSSLFKLEGNTKRGYLSKIEMRNLAPIFLSGSLSGVVVSMFSCPLEIIKIQLQSKKLASTAKSNNYDFIKTIYRSEGIRSFYRGFKFHCLRDFIGSGTFFLTYELCKRNFHKHTDTIYFSLISLTNGGISGLTATSITFPIDLVKTKIQREAFFKIGDKNYNGYWDCIKKVYQSRGIRGFYHGISPTLIRSFPIHALNLFVYENVLRLINDS